MKPVALFLLVLLAAAGARQPRLETIENKIKRYGRLDFKMVGASEAEEDAAQRSTAGARSVWVNESSIDGMAIALLDGPLRRSNVVAYFEIHHLEQRGWDALVACYKDSNCRRQRAFKLRTGGSMMKRVGGPADMFYGEGAPEELGIAQRFGVAYESIREAQRLGLHLAAILRLYRSGYDGPTMQAGFKYKDEALAAVVRGMEAQVPQKVGDATSWMWKETDFSCAYITMDPTFEIDDLRRTVAELAPDFSARLERYMAEPLETDAGAAAGDVDSGRADDIFTAGIDVELPHLADPRSALAWFDGVWDVVTVRERDPEPFESVVSHRFVSGRWDLSETYVGEDLLHHTSRSYDDERGVIISYTFDALSARPIISEGKWDGASRTLTITQGTNEIVTHIDGPHTFEVTVQRELAEGAWTAVKTSRYTRRGFVPAPADERAADERAADERAADEGAVEDR